MKKGRLLSLSVIGFAALVFVTAAQTRNADTLTLKADFKTTFDNTDRGRCATGADSCLTVTGSALVPGLGNVASSYLDTVFAPPGRTCDAVANQWPFATGTDVLTVAGKGEIDLALKNAAVVDSHGCLEPSVGPVVLTFALSFAVTGGTGTFAGASGSGTLAKTDGRAPLWGHDVFSGTLTAPGVTFDRTPPTISGASSRTVVARTGQKRVRLAVKITAHDAVDGAVAATCKPKAGSLVPLGRTRVSCSATDSSGNTAHAQFTYTVKKPR